MKKGNAKNYDGILILIILLEAFVLWGVMQLISRPGDMLFVICDGEAIGKVSLDEAKDRYYLVQYGNAGSPKLIELIGKQVEESIQDGEFVPESESVSFYAEGEYNLFMCSKDGTVQMLAASCPDKICVNHRAIKAAYENIICLPHRLTLGIISVRESETEGLDGIAY